MRSEEYYPIQCALSRSGLDLEIVRLLWFYLFVLFFYSIVGKDLNSKRRCCRIHILQGVEAFFFVLSKDILSVITQDE